MVLRGMFDGLSGEDLRLARQRVYRRRYRKKHPEKNHEQNRKDKLALKRRLAGLCNNCLYEYREKQRDYQKKYQRFYRFKKKLERLSKENKNGV